MMLVNNLDVTFCMVFVRKHKTAVIRKVVNKQLNQIFKGNISSFIFFLSSYNFIHPLLLFIVSSLYQLLETACGVQTQAVQSCFVLCWPTTFIYYLFIYYVTVNIRSSNFLLHQVPRVYSEYLKSAFYFLCQSHKIICNTIQDNELRPLHLSMKWSVHC